MRTRTARRSTLHHVGLTAFPADPNSQLLRTEHMDDVVDRAEVNAAIRRCGQISRTCRKPGSTARSMPAPIC